MSKIERKIMITKSYQNLLISKPVVEALNAERERTGKSKSVITEEALVMALEINEDKTND